MTKTTELLDAAKVASGCETDYQFAKRHKLTVQTVSTWRQGKATFSDEHAAMVAGILGREPGEIMALCHAEREKTEAGRARWLRVAALLAAIVSPTAGASIASPNLSITMTDCKLSAVGRRIRRILSGPAVRMA